MRVMASFDAILERLREAECVFCFLDYDGALAPLVPAPDEAIPVPGMAQARTNVIWARHLRDYLLLFRFLAHKSGRVIRFG